MGVFRIRVFFFFISRRNLVTCKKVKSRFVVAEGILNVNAAYGNLN